MRARVTAACALALALALACAACAPAARPRSSAEATSSEAPPPAPAPAPAPPPPAPVTTSALPPPTPKKPGCLDSTRGAKHTFVGKLEKHPDGSGVVRVHLAKRVCFSGGRFSEGETDEVILDIEESRAKPLYAKKVKVSGTSQDLLPAKTKSYVMRLEVTSLVPSK